MNTPPDVDPALRAPPIPLGLGDAGVGVVESKVEEASVLEFEMLITNAWLPGFIRTYLTAGADSEETVMVEASGVQVVSELPPIVI